LNPGFRWKLACWKEYVKAASVIHIGKKANNIDEQALKIKRVQKFIKKRRS